MLRLAAAFLVALLVGQVMQTGPQGRSITLAHPGGVADLHQDGTALAMRYQMTGQGQMQVTARFQPQDAGAEAREVVLYMDDGESITFALPGPSGPVYRFSRRGAALTASVAPTPYPDAARTS